jgi:hypothetical protein
MKKKLFLACLGAVLGVSSAGGQTFTVNNTGDSPLAGSLRFAINQANAAGGAARINFAFPGPQTIVLQSALPIISNRFGVTINGGGSTIYGGSTSATTGDRVFFFGVSSGESNANLLATTSTNYTLSNLTVFAGNARGGNGSGGGAGLGGGVFVNAGNLTLNSVVFSGNIAVGGNGSSADSRFSGGGGMGGNGNDGGGGFGVGANGGISR